jgi:heat shock protein HtpX
MTSNNTLKTALLLGLLTGFLMLIGGALGGTGGLIFAFVFAIAINMGAWWFSDSIALKFSGAYPVTEAEAPELHRMVDTLVAKANMPRPRLFMIDSPMPNAFATGRSPEKGAVAVTTGLMQLMSRDEVMGVVAHELAHIKNRDTLISSVAATIAGAIGMIADMVMWGMIFGGLGGSDDDDGAAGIVGGILTIILAPIVALLIQLAISRSREFAADEGGASIMGDPEPLARALEKLESFSRNPAAIQAMRQAHVNPGTAHLYIVNPLAGSAVVNLFRTHPPTEERIAKLRALAPALAWKGQRAAS